MIALRMITFFFLANFTVFLLPEALLAREISVASFNIRWYGRELHGAIPSPEPDSRNDFLADYIATNLASADVIAFAEIVDKEGFERDVLRGVRTCQSYDQKSQGHQHVMICYKKDLKFITANIDGDFIIEEATLGRRLRPIVHGVLVDGNGKQLAYIAAVHLKANPGETATRLQQIGILAEKMRGLAKDLPAIVVGDFNTHDNDVADITQSFADAGLQMRNIYNANEATFRTPSLMSKLDHFWVNQAVSSSSPIITSWICRKQSHEMECSRQSGARGCRQRLLANSDEYQSVEEYNAKISDHCFIQSSFRIAEAG